MKRSRFERELKDTSMYFNRPGKRHTMNSLLSSHTFVDVIPGYNPEDFKSSDDEKEEEEEKNKEEKEEEIIKSPIVNFNKSPMVSPMRHHLDELMRIPYLNLGDDWNNDVEVDISTFELASYDGMWEDHKLYE